MLLAKFQSPGNGAEEFGRIRRRELLVKRNRGCETSHQVRPRAADQATILNLASERRCFSLHDYRLPKRRDEHEVLAMPGFGQQSEETCSLIEVLDDRLQQASRDFARSHFPTMACQIIVRDCRD